MAKKPLELQRKKKQTRTEFQCIVHHPSYGTLTKATFLSEKSFQTIQEGARIRQCQENPGDREDEICSNLLSEFHALRYGYHRQYYQRFTNVLRLLKRKKRVSSEHLTGPKVAKRRRTEETLSTPSPLLPSDRCLFCDKKRLTKNREEEKLVKCVTKTSEESIKAAAESKQDETILLKVRGVNLVVKEAHYHNSCRKE